MAATFAVAGGHRRGHALGVDHRDMRGRAERVLVSARSCPLDPGRERVAGNQRTDRRRVGMQSVVVTRLANLRYGCQYRRHCELMIA
ncbi:MAG: hypothetical protein V5B59_20500 [Candidatus Accumulibacter contiguus]|jgi:hypothetical protein